VPDEVVGHGLSRLIPDSAADIATWLDTRDPVREGDLTRALVSTAMPLVRNQICARICARDAGFRRTPAVETAGLAALRASIDRKLRNHIRLIQALGVDVTIPRGRLTFIPP
jgi:hypothetical protein